MSFLKRVSALGTSAAVVSISALGALNIAQPSDAAIPTGWRTSFEKGFGGMGAWYNVDRVGRSSRTAHAGSYSLDVDANRDWGVKERWPGHGEVEPGRVYAFSGWVRTAAGAGQRVHVSAVFVSSSSRAVSTVNLATVKASRRWAQYSTKVTIPDAASSVVLRYRGKVPGRVYIDDLRVAAPAPTATPTTTPPWSCVTSEPQGNCGAYSFSGIVNSNGYNTYVSNSCWADPDCKQTISANSPADWQVVSNEPEGNTAVMTYPNVQQLFNNWCGAGVWGGCANPTDTPMSALADLKFGYAVTMPPESSGTIAQAAYDIWTSDPKHSEVMIWVNNDNRESGGARFDASYTTSDGRTWSLYFYGDEVIWSLGARGTFAQRASMSDVPVYELMKYLVDHGYQQPNSLIGQIDFGWEICSTGGRPQTFTVNDYSITTR